MFFVLKNDYFQCGYCAKVTRAFLVKEAMETLSKLKSFQTSKERELPYYQIKGT